MTSYVMRNGQSYANECVIWKKKQSQTFHVKKIFFIWKMHIQIFMFCVKCLMYSDQFIFRVKTLFYVVTMKILMIILWPCLFKVRFFFVWICPFPCWCHLSDVMFWIVPAFHWFWGGFGLASHLESVLGSFPSFCGKRQVFSEFCDW